MNYTNILKNIILVAFHASVAHEVSLEVFSEAEAAKMEPRGAGFTLDKISVRRGQAAVAEDLYHCYVVLLT